MKEQLEKRIKRLKVELEAVQKMMNDLEHRRTDSEPSAFRTKRQAISKRGILGLIILAVFLLLAGNLQSQPKNDNALFIDSSGRVGIGTEQPQTQLEIAPNQAIKVGNAYLSSGGDYAHLATNEWYDGKKWQATAPGALIQISGQNTSFLTHDEKGSHINRMIVNSAGNVGIGTIDPKAKLEITAPSEGVALKIGRKSGQPSIKGLGDWLILDAPESGRLGLNYWEKGNVIIANGGGNVGIGTPSPKSKLEVVGDAMLSGKLTHSGRWQVDDLPETTYQISPRYHLTLSGRVYGGKTKTIPQDTLKALCADPDGCQVRLAMTRWSADTQTESASVFFTFYYSPTGDGHWRASSTDAGNALDTDGNGKITHVRNLWDTCFFTDGTYANYRQVGDKEQGMQLLVWNGYKNINRTCELTLID